jgi:predicted 3-demethylubiquinone-9 3-methyltransferase (glyoxalase superfamily)
MTAQISKIVPHLWFDRDAGEAVAFYTSLFSDSIVSDHTVISGTPSGDVDIITFRLSGQKFMAINAGPLFKFNESVSFFVYCGSEKETDRLYESLSEGGSVIFPLDRYDWSPRYAWVKDKFGLSWQLDVEEINSPQKIVPNLLFVNKKSARVKEAVEFYTSVFPGSDSIMEAPWHPGSGMPEGSLLFAQYRLSGFLFNSMSSNQQHDYDFNEALSFMIYCDSQDEIDYYWEKLTDGGKEQPCGWIKDRFGLSWQVVPFEMDEMMATKDRQQLARVTAAMLQMMKPDIGALKKAYRNN